MPTTIAVFRDDAKLMKELGLRAYQFSVPWSRIVPGGDGAVDEKGLDFYDALVDALLAAGIAPVPVLYVWELPRAAQDRGGWTNRDCTKWFAHFAEAAFRRLGDRARHSIGSRFVSLAPSLTLATCSASCRSVAAISTACSPRTICFSGKAWR